MTDKSASALEAVALHERALLEKISQAEQEAARIVARARAEAETLHEETLRRLEQETGRLRREAAEQRAAERDTILARAEERIRQIRKAAADKVQGAAAELAELVLPHGARGSR